MNGGQFFHWIKYHAGLEPACTQTTDAERDVIRTRAAGCRHAVEIGVFEGVTSRVIREAIAPDGELTCIDPFVSGRLGINYAFSISQREIARSRNGRIRFVRKYSGDAARDWAGPIDFLFIDADHSEAGVRRDWADWSPHIVSGGFVAFHDSTDEQRSPGPTRLVREIEQFDSAFCKVDQVDGLTMFQRVQV